MIELQTDPFDSDVWKKNVCKLRTHSPFTEEEIRAAISREQPDVVFAFVPFSPEISDVLFRTGFRLMSIRDTYAFSQRTETETSVLPGDVRTLTLADHIRISDADLHAFAVTIGETSRYFHDPHIPREDAIRLYEAWIRNSLEHGYADEVIVCANSDRIVGIVTLKIKDGVGSIDLIGVLPPFQGRGLGRHLLQCAVGYFRSNDIRDIVVVTEGENLSAGAFYQRSGFVIRDVELVFHAHPSCI